MDDVLEVVRGRQTLRMAGRELRLRAAGAARVVVDVGAGDGRWIYRTARTHPDWLCLAVDAAAEAVRDASRRAARDPSRGGAPNAWFIRAAAAALPGALAGLADEIHIHLPWGSLLRAVLAPDREVLRRLARVGRAGASLCVRVNAALLEEPRLLARLDLPAAGSQDLRVRLQTGYAAAGLRVSVRRAALAPETSWGRRLAGGRALPVLALDGWVADAAGERGVAPAR